MGQLNKKSKYLMWSSQLLEAFVKKIGFLNISLSKSNFAINLKPAASRLVTVLSFANLGGKEENKPPSPKTKKKFELEDGVTYFKRIS